MNKIDNLKVGLKIGDVMHREFEMRGANTGDMFAAEEIALPSKPISFAGAMLCQQLVRIGEFRGPFTLKVLGKLDPKDFGILRAAQDELDAEGEDTQPG